MASDKRPAHNDRKRKRFHAKHGDITRTAFAQRKRHAKAVKRQQEAQKRGKKGHKPWEPKYL